MNDLAMRITLGVLLAIFLISRRLFERRAGALARSSTQDTAESGLSIGVASVAVLAGFLLAVASAALPRWLAFASLALPAWLRWAGAGIAALGTALLLWAHLTLGRNFVGGATILEGHQLITDGPYRRVRHPMYVAFVILGLGYGLLGANWLVGGYWIVAMSAVALWRVPREEALMAAEFGDAYRDYMARSGRYLPPLSRR